MPHIIAKVHYYQTNFILHDGLGKIKRLKMEKLKRKIKLVNRNLKKKKPKFLAAVTSAASSGDAAWYLILSGDSSPSGRTVWQIARHLKNS